MLTTTQLPQPYKLLGMVYQTSNSHFMFVIDKLKKSAPPGTTHIMNVKMSCTSDDGCIMHLVYGDAVQVQEKGGAQKKRSRDEGEGGGTK